MSSRVLSIIKEVIDESLLNEGVQGVLVSIKGHDRKIPFADNVGKDSIWSKLRSRAKDPTGRPEAKEIASALEKAGFDINSSAGTWKKSDIITISDPIEFADGKEAKAWKEEQGRAAGKKNTNLYSLSKLPVYKIKDEDWKEYQTKSATGDQFKKQPIKPMAGDDIAKQDQGLGKNYKDPDAPKRDSDYVSVNKDTRDRNTTTGRDPKDAKWVRGINEDDSDVTDDEKKALAGDRSVKSGIDKVPGDVDTDDVDKDDAAAEAGKKERSKDHQYIKASSFKQYAKLYPELNNPNQKIVSKDAVKMSTDDLKFSGEKYYKILDPKRFAKVPNDFQLRPIADPFASGSEEAKLRGDLEGLTAAEKKKLLAKHKGQEEPAASDKPKSNFKAPTGKSGKPMKSIGQRDFGAANQVKESILSIIKQVIKEETSK